MPKFGVTQEKLLLLLLSGVALGFSKSPIKQNRILRSAVKEWQRINDRNLARSIRSLYQSRLISIMDKADGTSEMMLTKNGRQQALVFKIDEMNIKKPVRWDGRWRIVLFDIPERQKRIREALRGHLKQLSFYEYQKSVFIHPYDCRDEIDFIIELYHARRYVRFIMAIYIDNDLHLRQIFDL